MNTKTKYEVEIYTMDTKYTGRCYYFDTPPTLAMVHDRLVDSEMPEDQFLAGVVQYTEKDEWEQITEKDVVTVTIEFDTDALLGYFVVNIIEVDDMENDFEDTVENVVFFSDMEG